VREYVVEAADAEATQGSEVMVPSTRPTRCEYRPSLAMRALVTEPVAVDPWASTVVMLTYSGARCVARRPAVDESDRKTISQIVS